MALSSPLRPQHLSKNDRDVQSYDECRSAWNVSDHFVRGKLTGRENYPALTERISYYATGTSGTIHDAGATEKDAEVKTIIVSAVAASFFELQIDATTVLAVRVPAGETVQVPLGFGDYVVATGTEVLGWIASSAAEVTVIGKCMLQDKTLPGNC
jgi:hypothetical protein